MPLYAYTRHRVFTVKAFQSRVEIILVALKVLRLTKIIFGYLYSILSTSNSFISCILCFCCLFQLILCISHISFCLYKRFISCFLVGISCFKSLLGIFKSGCCLRCFSWLCTIGVFSIYLSCFFFIYYFLTSEHALLANVTLDWALSFAETALS